MKVMNVIKHLLQKMKPGFHIQAGVSCIHHPETKQKCSVKKLTVTVSLGQKGVLLVRFCDHGITVNADMHCEMLKILKELIQN